MSDLLSFEADRRAVNITINRHATLLGFPVILLDKVYYLPCNNASIINSNIFICSIGTELTRDDRRKLYSNFGLL